MVECLVWAIGVFIFNMSILGGDGEGVINTIAVWSIIVFWIMTSFNLKNIK